MNQRFDNQTVIVTGGGGGIGGATCRRFAREGAGNPEKLMEAFTRSIPLGRIGQPDDLAGAIVFFASDDAGYITGQVLSVSGGLTMNG